MPELPEVEILLRHLRPLLRGRTIRAVEVHRPRVIRPTPVDQLRQTLTGAKILDLQRRGKYLLFHLRPAADQTAPRTRVNPRPLVQVQLLGHLGMTGRMYLSPRTRPHPKHTAVTFDLGPRHFVYEDPRYFGRLTLDLTSLDNLGPEPWDPDLTPKAFRQSLQRSRQAIKIRLLDQTLIAGIGNIYASEALYRARISPRQAAHRLTLPETTRLLRAIRHVLDRAITGGSTIPLNFSGPSTDKLYYYGRPPDSPDYYAERLHVYDRAGRACARCGTHIRRIVQAARSTFYCPQCQKR